jgi:hypothetical protein
MIIERPTLQDIFSVFPQSVVMRIINEYVYIGCHRWCIHPYLKDGEKLFISYRIDRPIFYQYQYRRGAKTADSNYFLSDYHFINNQFCIIRLGTHA